MSQYRRKYLLRLHQRAIPHVEFERNSKQAVAIITDIGKAGYAECVNFDGEVVDPSDPDATWQITDAGEKFIGKHVSG